MTRNRRKQQNRRTGKAVGTLKNKSSTPVVEPSRLQTQLGIVNSYDCIPFGADNLLPYAIAQLCRNSSVHRGILNRKTEFIAGAKWTTENDELKALFDDINADGETLTKFLKKITFDKLSGGNGWIEIVTNSKRNYINFYHHDWTTCRLDEESVGVVISKDWRLQQSKTEKIKIPFYPNWKQDDGVLRSVIHLKDYEPEFHSYGVFDWIAGMNVVAIGYKTDRWNVNRLDNAFQPSGVFIASGEFNDPEEAEELKEELEDEFSGEEGQGKVIFYCSKYGRQRK